MVKKILRWVIRILLIILILLLLVYVFIFMRNCGYKIFSDEAKDKNGVAVEVILTVREDDSLMHISRELAQKDIVDNAYIFYFAARFSEDYTNIQPGDYMVSSSQKPSEILKTLTGGRGSEEE